MTVPYYQAVRDGHVTIDPNDSQDQRTDRASFHTTGDMYQNSTDSRPLLSFRVRPNDAQNLQLTVQINGITVAPNPLRFTGSTSQTYTEIVHNGVIRANDDNEITFELASVGGGSLTISDIIVWYMRNE